jgi:hypothetical protein
VWHDEDYLSWRHRCSRVSAVFTLELINRSVFWFLIEFDFHFEWWRRRHLMTHLLPLISFGIDCCDRILTLARDNSFLSTGSRSLWSRRQISVRDHQVFLRRIESETKTRNECVKFCYYFDNLLNATSCGCSRSFGSREINDIAQTILLALDNWVVNCVTMRKVSQIFCIFSRRCHERWIGSGLRRRRAKD